jgi:hypothetical protein
VMEDGFNLFLVEHLCLFPDAHLIRLTDYVCLYFDDKW